jgi:hypothetical protein
VLLFVLALAVQLPVERQAAGSDVPRAVLRASLPTQDQRRFVGTQLTTRRPSGFDGFAPTCRKREMHDNLPARMCIAPGRDRDLSGVRANDLHRRDQGSARSRRM